MYKVQIEVYPSKKDYTMSFNDRREALAAYEAASRTLVMFSPSIRHKIEHLGEKFTICEDGAVTLTTEKDSDM